MPRRSIAASSNRLDIVVGSWLKAGRGFRPKHCRRRFHSLFGSPRYCWNRHTAGNLRHTLGRSHCETAATRHPCSSVNAAGYSSGHVEHRWRQCLDRLGIPGSAPSGCCCYTRHCYSGHCYRCRCYSGRCCRCRCYSGRCCRCRRYSGRCCHRGYHDRHVWLDSRPYPGYDSDCVANPGSDLDSHYDCGRVASIRRYVDPVLEQSCSASFLFRQVKKRLRERLQICFCCLWLSSSVSP